MTLPAAPLAAPCIFCTFHGDTYELLRQVPDGSNTVVYPLCRRASIKDIVESLGVPHTEIGRIVLDGQEVGFATIPEGGERFQIHPLTPQSPPTVATYLRPEPIATVIFLVDINVGRLAGLLRMVGIDAELVGPGIDNTIIIERAVQEGRIILTRNRDLLRHRRLVFGRFIRSQDPDYQLQEIIKLYNLRQQLRPFSRCISCNGLLADVAKDTIIDDLLPLTKKYYTRFKRCSTCRKIFWQGSHHQNIVRKLSLI